MKKNIYELSKKEANDYETEFNKTEFAKKALKQKHEALIAAMVGLVSIFVISMINVISSDVSGKDVINTAEGLFSYLPTIVFILGSIAYAYNFVLLKICFFRWLKTKHNIEY